MVEQSIRMASGGRLAEHAVAIDLGDMLAGRQHGDDRSAPSHASAADAARGAAALGGAAERFLAKVEGADFMPGLGEVRRHPAAHVAEPDECDLVPSSAC